MRPVDLLFGGPVGAVKVEFDCDHPQGESPRGYATVICRNGMTNKENVFHTDTRTGQKIQKWIEDGKPGLIQEALPDLDDGQREMVQSGITPKEWDEMWGGPEE